ncbi:MAG: biotin transporter BioY [Planctomycetes bacterium]|nr:biotin transporter BioY [Planctomycetota bacterium]
MNQPSLFAPVLDRFDVGQRRLVATAAVLMGSLLLLASSRMSLPIGPVPLTMQSLMAIALGLVLGSRLGAAAAMLYFLQCLAIPGFSAGAMPLTGGFVLGFVPAAFLAGWLFERGHGRSLGKALLASIPANLVIFAFGLPWLAIGLGLDFERAWAVGAAPFMVVEAVKIGLGVVMLRGLGLIAGRRA